MNFGKIVERLKEYSDYRPTLKGMPYWLAAAIVGVIAVIYSDLFNECIERSRQILTQHHFLIFLWSPLCFFVATWLVEKFAPKAGGTGIPRVTHALSLDCEKDANEIYQTLNFKTFLVIFTSSLLCVLGGGALGREGPMIHMSACMFFIVGQRFQFLYQSKEHQSWIMAGGATGIAAAFNAPLAGVVFVLEELSQLHFHRFKTVVITCAIVGGAISQWLSGRFLYLGYPHIAEVPLSSIGWATFLGIVCGILSYPFHRLLRVNWREILPHHFKTRLGMSVLIGCLIAALALFWDPRIMGGGTSLVEELLFTEGHFASWKLIIGRFVATLASNVSGCSGGFLAPSLALGAAIGSKFAYLTGYANPQLLVLVGMSAFLSAIVRAPFTAWVIVMEMTDRHSAIFPLMIASVVSYAVSRRMWKTET